MMTIHGWLGDGRGVLDGNLKGDKMNSTDTARIQSPLCFSTITLSMISELVGMGFCLGQNTLRLRASFAPLLGAASRHPTKPMTLRTSTQTMLMPSRQGVLGSQGGMAWLVPQSNASGGNSQATSKQQVVQDDS